MTDARTIDDSVWTVLLESQRDLIKFFVRVAQVPREVVEDCISEAMIDFCTSYDSVEIGTCANTAATSKQVIIFSRMREFSQKRLNREKTRLRKLTSDDTPISEDTDMPLHLRDLFVGRGGGADRIENYAEWKMFARRSKSCPLSEDEIDTLFGV